MKVILTQDIKGVGKKDEIIKKGDVILVKASRGMEMEEIVNNILEG